MVDGIGGAQAKSQVQKAKNTQVNNNSAYQNAQEALAAQIQDPPRGLTDLKHNASIKERQIDLARQNGDMALVAILQKELAGINADIQRGETSIFDVAKSTQAPKQE